MDYEFGEWLTRCTIRVAVACYVGRLWIDLGTGRSGRSQRAAQVIWTAGCAFYLLHVAAAFHFHHNWSHAAAYEHTADQTAALTGIHWGGGLYFNYAFTLLWVGDVLAWWAIPGRHAKQPAGLRWGLHAVFAFMVFNAIVVFGPPFWKPVGAIVAAALLLKAMNHHRTVDG
jgi:hypothetical protein